MSNNCQDFAIKFFLDTCDSIYNLEDTLKTLKHGHHGFNPLIKYKKADNGDFLVYDRDGKYITQFTPRHDVDAMYKFITEKPPAAKALPIQIKSAQPQIAQGLIKGSVSTQPEGLNKRSTQTQPHVTKHKQHLQERVKQSESPALTKQLG